jgi:NAD(P)-dependent dehydrogenase (short-subunit alcohol dehydrogenase family)
VKLHSLGAKLAITDINQAGVDQTVQLCGSGGGGSSSSSSSNDHLGLVLDVSKSQDVQNVVEQVINRFGGIDHVYNCAGINPTVQSLVETSEEHFDKLVAVNLKGLFNVTKATVPAVTKSRGSYVNVSSISGLHGSAGTAVYCATKFGVVGFSKSMAKDLGPQGVRTNIVCPGFIDTPTNAGIAKGTKEAREDMEKANCLERLGTPEEIADVSDSS